MNPNICQPHRRSSRLGRADNDNCQAPSHGRQPNISASLSPTSPANVDNFRMRRRSGTIRPERRIHFRASLIQS